jgi:hypothetical protein
MMVKRNPKKRGGPQKGEQAELSTRMRDLLLVSTVEERRTSSPDNARPDSEQRRRDDAPTTPEQRAS